MHIMASAITMMIVFLMFLSVVNIMLYGPVEPQTGKPFDDWNITFITNTQENQ